MRSISLLGLVLFVALSCKKEDPTVVGGNIVISNGMMVLCEGLYQQNNTSLSWINNATGSIINDYFVQTSSVQLGDTGNDMDVYGGKIYIAMTSSSTIQVLSALTGVQIKNIPMFDGLVAKEPRSVGFFNGKVYVTCYDGYVDVIDTTTLEVEARILVGNNPEDITEANGMLYVTNSGGLNFPNVDSTVSVINPVTNLEELKITVGINPGDIVTDAQGDVYVISRGDYGAIPSRMHRINTTTNTVVEDFTFDASSIASIGDDFLIGSADFAMGTNIVALFDPVLETITNSSLVDLTGVQAIYGIKYNPSNDHIYILDAMDFTTTGFVREFTSSGVPVADFHVGLNPSSILFFN
ncbi:MAG: YVTN family beta-propeller protein [Flavobacteriaceae bacterium]|jgi:YVTN family beta-propeller protein